LLDDLDRLDWPEAIKLMQRNWIGRSEGARVRFGSTAGPIEVFTTRPDTLFGATFMVLSPEHPLVNALTTSEQQTAVAKYRETAAALQDADRTDDSRKKTGVFIGAYATNPVNGAQIPVWIADYVLMGYGTGAIMAVPSGDERDMEFATAYNLPVIEVVNEDGEYVNSSNDSVSLNGKRTKAEAISLMTAWLEKNGHGNSAITYKLRDWLFSRQRYWGEPFPIVYDENDQPISVPASALPVLLPELADFKPQALDPNDETTNPIPPLARIQDWVNVTLDLGDGPKQYRREVNVMPQWAGSCWYELRYLDPTNSEAFIDKDVEKYWMGPKQAGHTGGVDLYVGGVEHAVLHLLYARFWHKVLHDLGHVSSEEPFHRLFNQGYIQAYAYRDERGQTVPANEVEEANGAYTWQGEKVIREYGKMGKSLKNIVTPDEMYDEFGADTFRLYEMSTGPLDASRPWNTRDVVGMQRFLQRSWRNLVDEDTGALHVSDAEAPLQLKRDLHKAIHGVGIDMQNLRFNTAISKLIELNNALTIYVNEHGSTPREVAVPLVQMLSPLCPHMAEELWSMLGQTTELTFAPFPVADPALLVSDTIEIPIQVNGKVRSKLSVVPTVTDDELRALALADEKVIALLNGAEPAKVVIVPKRLVNVVL
jgi:leucyl-tRNA synthetase